MTLGYVTARVVRPVGTDEDGDGIPTRLPATGQVRFEPHFYDMVDGNTNVMRESVIVPIVDGDFDWDGQTSVPLQVGQWRVTITSTTGGTYRKWNIVVTAEHTLTAPLSLADSVPYVPAPGTPVTLLQVPSDAYAGAILGWDHGLEWQPNPTDSIPAAVADYLTANPPSGSPDATTLTKGIVRLAGDLGGTADAPTVPGLADKADSDHTHTLADVTDYTPPDLSDYATMTLVGSVLADKADAGHWHDIEDVTGLQGALDGKQPAGDYAAATHNHDDRYFTEDETTALLGGKAAAIHEHAVADVTGLQGALDGKQAAGSYASATHNHDDRYYTEAETDALLAGKQPAGDYAAATHNHTGTYAPALGPDDNYVTDAEKTKLANLSGINTGDQTLPTWTSIAGKPAVVAAGADAAAARATIGAGTSSFSGAYADLTGKPTLGTAAATASTDYATADQGVRADTALQPATGQAINAQTGTTYTLVAGDAGKLVTLTNAAAITLTVPGSVFSTGQRVDVLVLGAGMVTVVGSSCTVNGTPSLVSRAQYSAFTVLFTSATTAVVVGDLASA